MSDMIALWYKQPARYWEEALPLGNGRLGAMVFGGIANERIALNEDTLWSGYPRPMAEKDVSEHYRKAQMLVMENRYAKAQEYIEQHLLGSFTQSYMPLCDILLTFLKLDNVSDYTRRLSLSQGGCTSEFTYEGIRHTREVFVSHPNQAMYIRLWAECKGQISFALRFDCKLRHTSVAEEGRLILKGICPSNVVPSYLESEAPVVYIEDDACKGMRFFAIATIEAEGGSVIYENDKIIVQNADAAVIRFTARTSFNGFDNHPYLQGCNEEALCSRDMQAILNISYNKAKALHIADHAELFNRVQFELGPDQYANEPTDKRLKQAYPDDNGLCSLLYHYGRYLLIASSRKGTEPANLQGIWNEHLRPVWSCNYTININSQMNYWLAEPCNLSECHEPLFDLVSGLLQTGAETARFYYGAQGSVSHHNTDIWRLSNPVGEKNSGFAGCAFFPMSLGWLCAHLMEHYRYTDDMTFLKERALPAIRETAKFYLDILFEDEDGRKFITPATSPENALMHEGKIVKVAKKAAMNNIITREVLQNYLQALNDLQIDEPMKEKASAALACLPGYAIGSRGQILEWDYEYEEPEPHHRHVSHLYGLYPGHEITVQDTKELALACRRSLKLRGNDGTGWSLAWKTNLWARLGDGEQALRTIRRQLRYTEPNTEMNLESGGTYLNLLDAHPPFQIDGNFGISSGIAQMLLQSRDDRILLLPALPTAWQQGSVKGLRAYHGVEVDIEFLHGRLKRAEIHGYNRKPLTVQYQDKTLFIPADASDDIAISDKLYLI